MRPGYLAFHLHLVGEMTTVINYVAIYHHVVMDFMLREQDPHLSICCSMCVLFHRGIEWVSLTSFLSFATSAPNNMGLVRNELQHVNLPTGKQPDTHKKHINLKSFPHLRLLIHTYWIFLFGSFFAQGNTLT